ncbi:MAG TPA: hypothetical protein VHG91_21440 [Longimicrobium sp.]|nr:hypothetical protein [Longimicrobium sp.]
MKKLKLDALEVTSFATTPSGAMERGTVDAHMPKPGGPIVIQTYNIDLCGDTYYFDCTLGCSRNSDCAYSCVGID